MPDDHMYLPEVRWLPDMVILDIETTGGSHLFDRITEIALVRIQDGEIVDTWQSLINPGSPIPITITYLTGITDEMVKNAPTFEEIAPTLYQYLEGLDFTRSARQIIMSKTERSKLHEGYQIHGRV